jgi:Flp pilus assembly pilin Flp
MSEVILKLYMKFVALRFDDEGQDLVEYALLLCLISLVLISAINGISTAVNTTFSNISASLA